MVVFCYCDILSRHTAVCQVLSSVHVNVLSPCHHIVLLFAEDDGRQRLNLSTMELARNILGMENEFEQNMWVSTSKPESWHQIPVFLKHNLEKLRILLPILRLQNLNLELCKNKKQKEKCYLVKTKTNKKVFSNFNCLQHFFGFFFCLLQPRKTHTGIEHKCFFLSFRSFQ